MRFIKNMQIAVMADIHSNLEALEAFLNCICKEKINKFICLGDIVGYGASPNECVEVISKSPNLYAVSGNHDWGVLGKTDLSCFNEIARIAIIWTQNQLNSKAKDYLGSLPLISIASGAFLVHATPEAPADWNYLVDVYDARRQFQHFNEKICFVGHSHVPMAFELNETTDELKIIRDKKFSIADAHCRYLINVGSIGQPRDGDPRASFVIWNVQDQTIEFRRVTYNIKRAQQKIRRTGLPLFLASRLSVGR
ncbi:MAG: metallophosphoesterase family protein [candidate division WOR-3 bacterium]